MTGAAARGQTYRVEGHNGVLPRHHSNCAPGLQVEDAVKELLCQKAWASVDLSVIVVLGHPVQNKYYVKTPVRRV